jgi:signal transduction histidine kinase
MRVPLIVVVLSLTLAILLPWLAERRVQRLRDEINDFADPARLRVAQIQLELALEGSQRRGYLLAGDEALEKEFLLSRSRRRGAEQELVNYARRLDTPGSSVLAGAALTIQQLNRGLDSLISRSGPVSATTLEEQRRRFLAIHNAADSLGARLDSATIARRSDLRATQSTVSVLTAGLVLLGLAATFLVGRLERRFRSLAIRLDENALERERLLESERAAREIAERRKTEIERITESRARLLRGFTHDVKNPLGAADGYLALLDEGVYGELEDRQRGTIGKSRRSIRHALELIGQLLDVARAESGQLEVRRQRTDVAEQVREVADAFVAQATAKGLSVDVAVPGDLPAIETDAARLRQIVGNLVSNAVKYTRPGGRIAVNGAVSSDGQRRDDQEILITVSDDGPGIPADKLPLLFTEFTRFDPAAAEGAGIGLAISQRIAAALGGEITVESRLGAGTTFALHLPLA